MNDIPPQQPPYPPQPGQPVDPQAAQTQQYGQVPPGPEDPTKKLKRTLIFGGIAALVLIVGAFFAGQKLEADKYKPGEAEYEKIYAAGQASGTTSGEKSGQLSGFKEGVAKGLEKGKKAGLEEGEAEGEAQGQQDGASAALGGLSGWSTDVPYVVQFEEGPNKNVPYAISSRLLMQPGVYYKICDSGANVCVAQPNNGGGGSGGGATGATQ